MPYTHCLRNQRQDGIYMAYDLDLRVRAMALLAEGKTGGYVAEVLGVGRVTVTRWKKRDKEDMLGAAYPKRRKTRKIDEDALKKYVEGHPDAYLHEIAEALGCSKSGVEHAIARLGITRKKLVPA